ncbi:hypothetical protein ACFQ4X_17780 [Fictibacillus halophilus]|jgi:hypothetical protein|uniref:hypothetical protein n=1 Tax=Fictibacillus halophilus TaxID=1610490 RepID=UPI00362BB4F5
MPTKTLDFIEPKNKNAKTVDWHISEQTRSLVKYYAEYCEITEDEVVDLFLSRNLVKDENFISWIEKRRNNKRIMKSIGLEL